MRFDLRYVHQDVDRHGNVRLYVHKRGTRKIRIRAPSGSDAFLAEYKAALSALDNPQAAQTASGPSKPLPGTWRALVSGYAASPAFKALDPRTQRVRRGILDHTCLEPVAPGAARLIGDMPLTHFSAKVVKVLRDRKADAPEAGNARVKAVRQVFAWALDDEQRGVRTNPARDVAYLKGAGGGFHSWTRDEVDQYKATHPEGTKARLAIELMLLTGVRRSDVVTLGRQHRRDGWFRFVPFKGRKRAKLLEIPVLPELAAIIDASPCGDLAFLVTAFGRPFTANGFGNRFRKWCDEAGLPAHCACHGLRKAGAAIAAENGATEHQLMAIFGWDTAKEAQRYTRAARRKKMAADGMGLLVREELGAGETGNDCSPPRSGDVFPTAPKHRISNGK